MLRDDEMAFLKRHQVRLLAYAWAEYVVAGRGALVVPSSAVRLGYPQPDEPILYLPIDDLFEHLVYVDPRDTEYVRGEVTHYEPHTDAVIVFLHDDLPTRTIAFRVPGLTAEAAYAQFMSHQDN